MTNGFLGYNTTFMLDFVVCALVLIVPVLAFSVYQVKVRHNYRLHRNLQLFLGVTLLVAVAAFEVDVQFIHGGWENIVNREGQPPRLAGDALADVRRILYVHLCFAISTPLLWATTIVLALKRFPSPPQPGEHSRLHNRLAWLSTLDLVATSVTGLWFYYSAFVRTLPL
jgi:putative membrane protein